MKMDLNQLNVYKPFFNVLVEVKPTTSNYMTYVQVVQATYKCTDPNKKIINMLIGFPKIKLYVTSPIYYK